MMSQVPAHFSIPPSTVGKSTLATSVHGWSDFLGLAVSVSCAIHCAAIPVLFAILPAWGMSWLVHHAFHKWMFAVCVMIAMVAFIPSILRHRKWMPIALGSLGLACLGFGTFTEKAAVRCDCQRCNECISIAESSHIRSASDRFLMKSESEGLRMRLGTELKQKESVFLSVRSQERSLEATAQPPNRVADSVTLGKSPSGDASVFGSLFAWLTPLGGLFLVVAHLLNHHFGNDCRCS